MITLRYVVMCSLLYVRYRKLSAKVHPDKMREVEHAREAFEQVKRTYTTLCDDQQKASILMNIEFVENEFIKERKKLISKGVSCKKLYDDDDDDEDNDVCMYL